MAYQGQGRSIQLQLVCFQHHFSQHIDTFRHPSDINPICEGYDHLLSTKNITNSYNPQIPEKAFSQREFFKKLFTLTLQMLEEIKFNMQQQRKRGLKNFTVVHRPFIIPDKY